MRAAADARLADAGGRRPSVELLFHALLPEQFILHTHPVVMNAITCNSDGAALAGRLFGERVLWVPYLNPGLPLALAIATARRAHVERTARPAPAVTLMQNHGIIVAGTRQPRSMSGPAGSPRPCGLRWPRPSRAPDRVERTQAPMPWTRTRPRLTWTRRGRARSWT